MDHRTVYANLPTTVAAFTKHDPDFDTIVLNSRLSHERLLIAYDHELYKHINGGDFYAESSADDIETRAHIR